MLMKDIVQLQVTAKIDKLPFIIKFIENTMEKFGLDEYGKFQTQLAVDEAVTNVINHGKVEGKEKITITCQDFDEKIEITISDRGKPFNPTTFPEPNVTTSLEKRKPGGLGVYFIKKYMDKVDYQYKDGKNKLILTRDKI